MINVDLAKWVGGFFSVISEESSYLLGKDLYNKQGIKVGELPFIPEIITTSSRPWGSWYICSQLTEQENEELEMSYTHYEGSYYRTYVNQNSPYKWILWFLEEHIEQEAK